MSRKSELTFGEIQAAEKAKDERQRHRKGGFSLMKVRDAGWSTIRNFEGSEAVMQWHIPEERREEGVAYSAVPEGMFVLKVGKETAVFDAEEFRKSLRWA